MWGWEGGRGGFCKKTPEAAPMSDTARSRKFQDGLSVGQS